MIRMSNYIGGGILTSEKRNLASDFQKMTKSSTETRRSPNKMIMRLSPLSKTPTRVLVGSRHRHK